MNQESMKESGAYPACQVCGKQLGLGWLLANPEMGTVYACDDCYQHAKRGRDAAKPASDPEQC
jgi:RNA polymerase-binding transcription factor DksA